MAASDPTSEPWHRGSITEAKRPGTVIFDLEIKDPLPCLGRTVRVVPLTNLEQLPDLLARAGNHLQTVGTAGLEDRTQGLASHLGRAGVSRVVPFQSGAVPPPMVASRRRKASGRPGAVDRSGERVRSYALYSSSSGCCSARPYDHLTSPAWIFFHPDGQGVTLIDPQVFPHVLGNRNPPTDAYRDIRVIEGAIDGHSVSSWFVPEPRNLSKSTGALKRVTVTRVLHWES